MEFPFGSHKFYRSDGSFDPALFYKLLKNARSKLEQPKGKSLQNNNIDFQIQIGGISKKEVWRFISKLASFLTSGIDIKSAMGIASKQIKNPKLKDILISTHQNLDYGIPISESLKNYSKYFDPIIISLIEVGEKTGTLPRVLTDLEETLRWQIEITSKIRGAMVYPAILIFLSFSLVIFMLVFILPKITGAFAKAKVQLPALTQFMIDVSDFMRNHYIVLTSVFVAFVIGFHFFRQTYYGQIWLHRISLKIPVFGWMEKQMNIILFISSLSLLLNSGILMLEALVITAKVVPNIHFKRDIIRMKNEVEAWMKLSQSMWLSRGKNEFSFTSKYFTEDLAYMINVGEETGAVSNSIKNTGIIYEKELKQYVANIMSALEPIIIVFVGGMVGVIVLAIMMPFFELGKVAKNL